MKKIIYSGTFALIAVMLLSLWCGRAMWELENNIVRLHIIANSDSSFDQELKIKVRDLITQSAINRGATPNAKQMQMEANEILRKENAPYNARVTYGKYYVNRREYGNFVLPEGMYTAARIELGEARGKNWWCVLSPPLCFTRSALGETDALSKSLDRETVGAVDSITIKFKAVEWVSKLIHKQ